MISPLKSRSHLSGLAELVEDNRGGVGSGVEACAALAKFNFIGLVAFEFVHLVGF